MGVCSFMDETPETFYVGRLGPAEQGASAAKPGLGMGEVLADHDCQTVTGIRPECARVTA